MGRHTRPALRARELARDRCARDRTRNARSAQLRSVARASARRAGGRGAVHAAYRGPRSPRGLHLQQRAAQPRAAAEAGVTPAKAQMLDLINAERARAGAGLLRFDALLNAIAQARSQDMIDRHYFSHQIPGGGMVFDILDRDHVSYEMAGENIAMNNYIDFYSLAQTVRETNTDFMNSPEHRANILEPKYTEIGLGMAFERATGKLIVTEVFVQP